jgi:hypothetical protein
VITGDLVPLFLERMEQLLVGHDLLVLELDDRYASEFKDLVGVLIEYATAVMGSEEVEVRLAATDVDDQLEQSLAKSGDQWQVQQSPMPARQYLRALGQGRRKRLC